MPIRLTGLLCGGLLALSAASAAAAVDVSIRAEGKASTLVKERTVTVSSGAINKDGDPEHTCTGENVLGAIHAGTQGNWNGEWFEGLGYSISEIEGVQPKAPGYFELWVNHKLASTGACDTAVKAGDDVLLFVQDCEYDPAIQGCRNPVTPLGVRVAKKIRRNHVSTIKVVDYAPNGKATPERGATVFVNGARLGKTKKDGTIKVKGTKLGIATVYAKKAGHARSETDRVRIVK
jgi:hypothetical protein